MAVVFVSTVCATAMAASGTAAEAISPPQTYLGEPLLVHQDGIMRLVLLPPGPGNPRNSEGDLIRLRDGRVLLVYTHFTGGDDDHARAHLAGRFSRDGGVTWDGQDTLILPNEGRMNVMSVSLVRLNGGRIAMFYLVKNSATDCRPVLRISSDEGKTWGEPIPIVDKVGYYVLNNDRVVQLRSGRLVVPVAMHRSPDSTRWFNILMCYLSDDNGKTWRRSKEQVQGKTPEGREFTTQEPGIVPLADGRLLMHCRTDRGYHYFTYSRDEGDSWTGLEPSTLKGPCTAAAIERIPNTGDLLCLWNEGPQDKRLGLSKYTIAVSGDEGKTWRKVCVLEERKKPHNRYCCYCSILFVDDHVLLAHCNGHWGSMTTVHEALQITRFPIRRLYATNEGSGRPSPR